MKIHKGDTVKIMSGKDSGKTGKILSVDAKSQMVLAEGLNLVKKHARPRKQGEKGQIVSITKPIAVSKVMLICRSCGKPARVGYRIEEQVKRRYCKKCKNIL